MIVSTSVCEVFKGRFKIVYSHVSSKEVSLTLERDDSHTRFDLRIPLEDIEPIIFELVKAWLFDKIETIRDEVSCEKK